MRSWRHVLVAGFGSVFGAVQPTGRTTPQLDNSKPSANTSSLIDPDRPRTEQEVRDRQALQALAQQQVVFEQRRAQDDATFRLQRAMGWATFVIVPVSVFMALLEPLTLTAFGPASVLAFWNWRRLLKREPHELTPTTTSPAEECHESNRESDGSA